MGDSFVDDFADDFDGEVLDPRWFLTRPGGGTVGVTGAGLRLAIPASQARVYADAQIDDYDHLPRRAYRWRPPLRLTVRARGSAPQHPPALPAMPTPRPSGAAVATPTGHASTLRGTAGFGFWNYPFTPTGAVLAPPEAVWFFYASPPSDMALIPGVPGWGWKAQVIHARRWGALAALPPTLATVGWARLTGNVAPAAGWVRRLSGAAEAHLKADLADWHEYVLEWRPEAAHFLVDGEEVLAAPNPPRGPLGFVAWVDNQYAVATPRGTLRFGALDTPAQWLDLAHLRITRG